MGHAYRYSPYTGASLLVHLALADTANDQEDNKIWFRMARLADKARVDRKTANRAVLQMVEDGWLELLRAELGAPSIYRFVFREGEPVVYEARARQGGATDPTPQRKPAVTDPVQDGADHPRGGATDPRGGAHRGTVNPSPTQEITQGKDLTLLSPDGDDPREHPDYGFDRFWIRYPARDGKKRLKADAASKWRKMNRCEKEAAWRGVQHYAVSCAQGIDRPKDAVRWLRAGEWETWQSPAVPDPEQSRPASGAAAPAAWERGARANQRTAEAAQVLSAPDDEPMIYQPRQLGE